MGLTLDLEELAGLPLLSPFQEYCSKLEGHW